MRTLIYALKTFLYLILSLIDFLLSVLSTKYKSIDNKHDMTISKILTFKRALTQCFVFKKRKEQIFFLEKQNVDFLSMT